MNQTRKSLRRITALLAAACVCLTLAGCADAAFGEYTLDGGALVQVWGSETGLRRLTVTEADGEKTSFSLRNASIEPDAAGGLELIDLNFDGHDDVRIKMQRYTSGDIRYACFLWADGTLVRNTTIDNIRSLSVHPENETLTAWANYHSTADDWESRAYLTYVWYNGLPVPVAKTELIHYVEDEIYCLATYAADPGRSLEVVDENWIFPDALDEEKIWAEAVAAQDAIQQPARQEKYQANEEEN
ncbi:MAG: hypothetical protein IKL84_05520 [Clostridia bacterium]|nr:hypothetical protein [Clostridia bacterium]